MKVCDFGKLKEIFVQIHLFGIKLKKHFQFGVRK